MRPTTSPPLFAECHEIWEPKPPGTLWATPGLLWDWHRHTKLRNDFDATANRNNNKKNFSINKYVSIIHVFFV